MRERGIRTEFRGGDYAERFGLKSAEDCATWTELSEFLRVNREVAPYTEEEERETEEKLRELRRGELRGILHMVTSPGTAALVRQAIPERLRSYIQEAYYQVEGRPPVQTVPEFEGNIIHAGKNGEMSEEDAAKLIGLLKDRVGILLGGGPGYPTEASRTPLLRALEAPIQKNASVGGLCLGHQDLGVLSGGELVRGVVDAGPQIEQATEAGKTHQVISRLAGPQGDAAFGAQMFNTAVIIPGETATVLSEGMSTGHKPISVSYTLDRPGQGFGTQGHPEIPAGTPYQKEEVLQEDRVLELEGERIIIPRGTTEGMAWIVKFATDQGWSLFKELGMTPEDVRGLVDRHRAYPTLGRNFIGPMIDWMATRRLKEQR